MTRIHSLFSLLLILLAAGCTNHKPPPANPLFVALDNKRTGLDFSNDLSYNQQFNLFKYIYFYNGSGVGAGDFNNDGRIDLFFGSNQHQNTLYLNKGGLRFQDVTKQAAIPQDGGWSTGISVVDINNDGLLDIYVCRVGNFETLHSRNQLLINKGPDASGVPRFEDQAKAYGLDFSGFSTQAAFFDYDNDGDLDLFLLNHSVHQNGTFRPRAEFAGTYHPLSGDRIYRNDGAAFTDVTALTGINSTAIGYGLGISIADINGDGYPDIYIGNDFHENDYLYINQRNGTFREQGTEAMMHTSQYSMGVDVADVNNDAAPEIISMDMLPADPYILKRSLGEDTYDLFHEKIGMGYSYQYTRNNLQLNRRNGCFSETGLYSGVAATDWSWAPLWMDFDNDGWKDLFISNGIPKRMNDIDYINFVSNGEVQQKINTDDMQEKDMSLIEKFPEIKLPNKFFHNGGDLHFSDESDAVTGNDPTFSNGAVYADLDGDGDLDIVVNNIDHPAIVYENRSADTAGKSFLRLHLKGPEKNRHALGAKLVVYAGDGVRTYEKYPVRGFMSSMEIPLQAGIRNTRVDSALLIWPDRTYSRLSVTAGDVQLSYSTGLPAFDFRRLAARDALPPVPATDLTAASRLDFVHAENHFVEFDREPLIPHMVSTEGPALAVADINGDGLDDIFLGGARDHRSAICLQQPGGRFQRTIQPELDRDSSDEDVAACWTDLNRDGHPDLVVGSGGNEFYGNDPHNTPRVYLNDGQAHFNKLDNAFPDLYLTASTVAPCDINGDGYPDLFIGARAVPWAYGEVPHSYLLLNDRQGHFKDATDALAKDLAQVGLVTQALWFDIDGDGDQDLLIALEWGSITAFINSNGHFTKKQLSDKKGWWNFILPCDVDGDGRTDIIAGNLGLNSRLKASVKEPVRLYYNDFDGNGRKEQVLTYYIGGKEIPFATKAELEKQMPILKKKFLYAGDFAKASLHDLFNADKLEGASLLTADYFANSILLNKGGLQFQTVALPWEAQLSPYKDAVVVDANGDALPDILLVGNYYDNNIEMGRYDADYGLVLVNGGGGRFSCRMMSGVALRCQVRHVQPLRMGSRKGLVLACNSDSARIITIGSGQKQEKN